MASNDNEENRPTGRHDFDDDTDEAIVLPKPTPEITSDDEKMADSAFDDLQIVVDEDEVKAESDGQPSGRKY
ncbi:MAG TPA: hypothetical protein VIF57_31840 [Polyangia bacterium]|jgi:hypothetical protein